MPRLGKALNKAFAATKIKQKMLPSDDLETWVDQTPPRQALGE